MWRAAPAIARSRLIVARSLGSALSPKVQPPTQTRSHFLKNSSIFQSHRCLSQSSAHEIGDDGHADIDNSELKSQFSEGFSGNGDAQVDDFVTNDVTDSCGVGEGQMDQFVDGVDRSEDSVLGASEDADAPPMVYEIHMEKLENVLSLLESSTGETVEASLDGADVDLHEQFVERVLGSHLVMGENLIKYFKWLMKKPDFKVTARLVDALLLAVSGDMRVRDAYELWDLVKDIGEKQNGRLSSQSLNKLIASFSKLRKGKAALDVFNKFEELGCVPDVETYYFTIEALCRGLLLDLAASVCEKLLHAETFPNSEQAGKIISWFSKGGKAGHAHALYLLAKEKKCQPAQSSINLLISSLSQKDETVKLALETLCDINGDSRKYAIRTFMSVIRGLCRMKEVDEAKTLLLEMIREGPPPGNAAFNLIINAYSKSGDMDKAKEVMKLMESRGLRPDVFTYTVIISNYVNGGLLDEAYAVLSEAKKKHSKLTPATYHTLIRGHCKLEEFDKALKLFNEMKENGVQPTVDEYGKLIQSLCLKALDWKTADKLLDEMKENGLHLNGMTRDLIKAVKELETEVAERKLEITA